MEIEYFKFAKYRSTMHDMLIDWFQFTLFDMSLERVLELLFNAKVEDCLFTPSGLNGYIETYTYGHKMHVMNNDNRLDMGINVMFSGSACREYEELFDFRELIQKLGKIAPDKIKVSRIDIAIDYYGKDFNVQTIQKKCDNGYVTMKFRTYQPLYEAKPGNERVSEMVQFGSKSSDLHIVFYNKLFERINAGYEITKKDVTHWLRCELRFRHKNAQVLFGKMVKDMATLGFTIQGYLRNYLSFKVNNYLGDREHMCRAKECRWWTNFTGNVPKLRLEKEALSSNIYRKRRYIDMRLTKLISMVYVTDKNLFMDMLNKGVEKLDKHDLDVINAHFILNNQQVITYDEMVTIINNYKNGKL